jgi:hypothetical protein
MPEHSSPESISRQRCIIISCGSVVVVVLDNELLQLAGKILMVALSLDWMPARAPRVLFCQQFMFISR